MILRKKRYTSWDNILIPYKCCAFSTVLYILIRIIEYITPTIQIAATALFIEKALSYLSGSSPREELLLPILMLSGIIVYDRICKLLSALCMQYIKNGLRAHFHTAIIQKCANLTYANIESNETWELFQRIDNKPEDRMATGLKSIIELIGMGVQFLGFLGAMMINVWWVPFVVIILSAPIMILGIRGGKKQYEAERETGKYQIQYEYLGKTMTNRDSAMERSLFNYQDRLILQWDKLFKKAKCLQRKVTINTMVRMKVVSLALSLAMFMVDFIILLAVAKGQVSTGMFIALTQASIGIISIMSWEFSDRIKEFATQREFFKDITHFAALPETEGAASEPAPPVPLQSIEFRHVTFRYPNTEDDVIRDLCLKIEPGRHYAIVGRNGSGKTTLTKLLTGLYTDYEGEILINNKSIKNYMASELKSFFAVLFQDFARYHISLRDNIAIGDIKNFGNPDTDQNIEKVLNELDMTDNIHMLPDKINTHLGKLDEKGVDLSGGQWQRLAIARVMLSPAPMYILDEPTAALDPMSESKIYEDFEHISQQKTTLLISHRLGATKTADHILVLDDGHIVQQGSHAMLMQNDGLYKDMYDSQRSWYQ